MGLANKLMQVMNIEKPETRTFVAHSNLLRDVIERQAGSLDKSVIEGVMNLIEAKATQAHITITKDRLIIKDDGAGFKNREEILKVFEVFGKSRERKKEDKPWAEFQMGRGQLMAFGKTTYRSNTFKMVVDIRACDDEIQYDLISDLKPVPGCEVTVEFYNPIKEDYKFSQVCREISWCVNYVNIPVYLNGAQITESPTDMKWDVEDENFYYRHQADSRALTVYNMGVYVCELSRGESAHSGLFISKKPLKLNFARNSIITDCPIWRATEEKLSNFSFHALKNAKKLKIAEAQMVVLRALSNVIPVQTLIKIPLLKDTNGKFWNLSDVKRKFNSYSFQKAKSTQADKLIQKEICLVLDESYSSKVFCLWLDGERYYARDSIEILADKSFLQCFDYIDFDTVVKHLGEDNHIVPEADYSSLEKCVLKSLKWAGDLLMRRLRTRSQERSLYLGESGNSFAWTDGGNYIALNRNYVSKTCRDYSGWTQLLLIMAHEYAHKEGETEVHDADFYERYHKYSYIILGDIDRVMREFCVQLKSCGRKITKKMDGQLEAKNCIEEIGKWLNHDIKVA